jgi:hypothetical protein
MGENKVSSALRALEGALKALKESVMAIIKVIISCAGNGNNETIHRFSTRFLTVFSLRCIDCSRTVRLALSPFRNHTWSERESVTQRVMNYMRSCCQSILTHNRKALFVYTNKSSKDIFMINASP